MNETVPERLIFERGERRDGAVLLSGRLELTNPPEDIAVRFRHWAAHVPGRVLMSARSNGNRCSLTYADALSDARILRARLVEAGLRPGDRVATLLSPGLDALRLRLACLLGGYVHIALPHYPFRDIECFPPVEGEAARLWRIVKPELIVVAHDHLSRGSGCALALTDLPETAMALPDHEGEPGDWSAVFFTAGSTGASKGVPVTRGMISSCQSACAAMWPFLRERPPVLVDWMPWNHVFGGLDNLFKIIWNGGTLHRASAPSEEGVDELLELMAETAPTISIGVPLGLRLMLDRYDHDPERVAPGFRNATHIFFAGAAMDPALWSRLGRFVMDMEVRFGTRISILSGYGATEAASTMCLAPSDVPTPGILGWPLPGHEIALVPVDAGYEIRFRGPNLAPCYLFEDGVSPLPLDEEGFYRTGDAGILDGDALRFDGRLSEDFKLSSGTRVRAGALRAALMERIGNLADDIVLGGEGRDAIVGLVFAKTPDPSNRLASILAEWKRENPGSSMAVSRFAIADFAPDPDRGEVSVKGQLVHRTLLRNRAGLFGALSDGSAGTDVEM
ncbi:AMP-binding protein [Aliihoeflea sp. PC F10.4]